jgi:hypothetical protein
VKFGAIFTDQGVRPECSILRQRYPTCNTGTGIALQICFFMNPLHHCVLNIATSCPTNSNSLPEPPVWPLRDPLFFLNNLESLTCHNLNRTIITEIWGRRALVLILIFGIRHPRTIIRVTE